MRQIIRIHERDNVAVSIVDLPANSRIELDGFQLKIDQPIRAGHKIALIDIPQGQPIIKYGMTIGSATSAIGPGDWVHTHNLATNLSGTLDYEYHPQVPEVNPIDDGLTFEGFLRDNGRAGVRNEIWIIPTVGCVNEIAKAMATQANDRLTDAGTVDGVYAWPHPYGCSQLGEDHEMTRRILKGLAQHPNAGGVLVLALGCENNTLESFKELLGPVDSQRVKYLQTQDVNDEMSVGGALLDELIQAAARDKRQPIPVSELCIGLKCGGSDGFSGITGNPLVGKLSDMIIARGGSALLTEVPEMFGAETILMNRCVNQEVFQKTVDMVNGFKDYFTRYGQVVYENPSPGNKAGGISTLEDKSLGCTQKGGDCPVVDVLNYGEHVTTPGLNLLNGPGNDMVAVTVLAAAGAQIITFTTGRGTPLGAPVPTVKVATNSDLARRKKNWIDFNAGVMLEGQSLEQTATQLLNYLVDVASGKTLTKNEQFGFREIAIFKDGVTL